MNIVFSIALFGCCYLVSQWTGGEIIDGILLYFLLLLVSRPK
jgi:hypothetical protein